LTRRRRVITAGEQADAAERHELDHGRGRVAVDMAGLVYRPFSRAAITPDGRYQ